MSRVDHTPLVPQQITRGYGRYKTVTLSNVGSDVTKRRFKIISRSRALRACQVGELLVKRLRRTALCTFNLGAKCRTGLYRSLLCSDFTIFVSGPCQRYREGQVTRTVAPLPPLSGSVGIQFASRRLCRDLASTVNFHVARTLPINALTIRVYPSKIFGSVRRKGDSEKYERTRGNPLPWSNTRHQGEGNC